MRKLPAPLCLGTIARCLAFDAPAFAAHAAPSRKVIPTAKCRDGTYSYAHHARRTCLHHRDVAKWFLIVPD